MSPVGTSDNPLRVAVVGAGPAGFYTAERLFKEGDVNVLVDMYERLPTPFGLVRYGVAPDHQKIKSVTKAFHRSAMRPGFRFFGNVEFGKDVSLEDLQHYYHQIVFTTGAQTDRHLNIPGINLDGSHAATTFVAWYNGHPDFRDCQFDLSQEKVAVIGVGNVAVDVARILCSTPEELGRTDIADYALEALSQSKVKEVQMLGRRGPAQAAFTSPEAKELGQLEDCDTLVYPEEAQLDALSQAALADADRGTQRKVEIIQELSQREPTGKSKQLILRFLISPVELYGDEEGHVEAMKLVHNELYATEAGTMRPRATDEFETVDVGLVFRSIGYRGVPLPDVPFNDDWGVINNDGGRILDETAAEPVTGLYTAGWIKRGPTGVVGTNKPDAAETVENMLADLANGQINEPQNPSYADVEAFIAERQPRYVTYEDWETLDALEVAEGETQGRPRVKLTDVEDMLAALNK